MLPNLFVQNATAAVLATADESAPGAPPAPLVLFNTISGVVDATCARDGPSAAAVAHAPRPPSRGEAASPSGLQRLATMTGGHGSGVFAAQGSGVFGGRRQSAHGSFRAGAPAAGGARPHVGVWDAAALFGGGRLRLPDASAGGAKAAKAKGAAAGAAAALAAAAAAHRDASGLPLPLGIVVGPGAGGVVHGNHVHHCTSFSNNSLTAFALWQDALSKYNVSFFFFFAYGIWRFKHFRKSSVRIRNRDSEKKSM